MNYKKLERWKTTKSTQKISNRATRIILSHAPYREYRQHFFPADCIIKRPNSLSTLNLLQLKRQKSNLLLVNTRELSRVLSTDESTLYTFSA